MLTSSNLKGVREYYEFFFYKDWTPVSEDYKSLPQGWETITGDKGEIIPRSDASRQAYILNQKMNREWQRVMTSHYLKKSPCQK